MAGLNNLLSNTDQTTTTAPSWFTNAQASAAGQAGTAAANTPAPSQTTGQLSVNTLNNPNNAFAQGQAPLDTIAQGAANPWLIDDAGNATPNTSTPMGGLFNAQRNYFNQLLPNVTAPVDAQAIASGNFGSLRGLTANRKAIGDAYNQLVTQQNQAALQNQQHGVQAGAALGNLGQLQNQAQLETAKWQQTAPFAASTGYSNVLHNVTPLDRLENKQVQLSPLNQVGTITDVIGGVLGIGGTTPLTPAQMAQVDRISNLPRGTTASRVASGGVVNNLRAIGNWLSTQIGRIPGIPNIFGGGSSGGGGGGGVNSGGDGISGGSSEGENVDFPPYNTPEQNQPVAPEDFDPPEYNIPPTGPSDEWVDVPPEWGDQEYWTTPEEDYGDYGDYGMQAYAASRGLDNAALPPGSHGDLRLRPINDGGGVDGGGALSNLLGGDSLPNRVRDLIEADRTGGGEGFLGGPLSEEERAVLDRWIEHEQNLGRNPTYEDMPIPDQPVFQDDFGDYQVYEGETPEYWAVAPYEEDYYGP